MNEEHGGSVSTQPVIRLEGVERVFVKGGSEVRALAGIDLLIARGEYVAIMGPSGSGKSSLMNVLGCLDTPSRGAYTLNGNAVHTLADDELAAIRNREIGFVFQSFYLLPQANAVDNAALPLLYSGVSSRERRLRAVEVLEKVGLGNRRDHRPNELSGGECQRLAIARALVNEPSIILADEPTGNLDSATSEEIMEVLDNLSRQGSTVVVVTHEEDIAAHAERHIRLRDGTVVRDSRQ